MRNEITTEIHILFYFKERKNERCVKLLDNMHVPILNIFQIVFLGSLGKNACKSVENVNLEKHVTPYPGCVQMDVKTTYCHLFVKVAFHNLFNKYRVNKKNKEYIEMFNFTS